MPSGPQPLGFADFAGVKLVWYSGSAELVKRAFKYGNFTHNFLSYAFVTKDGALGLPEQKENRK